MGRSLWLLSFAASVYIVSSATITCEKSRFPYNEPDDRQCDKYYTCDKMVLSEHLCDDGFVYDLKSNFCALPFNVDCSARPKLQESQGTGGCLRRNGMFKHPDFCDQFFQCQGGNSNLITCPMGLIFDDKSGICEYPDVAKRPDCMPEDILKFKCPLQHSPDQLFPKGDDCRFFFRCLSNGLPRLGGCESGMVFHPEFLRCELPKFVPGCENYYQPSKGAKQSGISSDRPEPRPQSKRTEERDRPRNDRPTQSQNSHTAEQHVSESSKKQGSARRSEEDTEPPSAKPRYHEQSDRVAPAKSAAEDRRPVMQPVEELEEDDSQLHTPVIVKPRGQSGFLKPAEPDTENSKPVDESEEDDSLSEIPVAVTKKRVKIRKQRPVGVAHSPPSSRGHLDEPQPESNDNEEGLERSTPMRKPRIH